MPSWLSPVLLSVLGTAASLVAAYFIARSAAKKWADVGGQAAEARLLKTLQDNAAADAEAMRRRDERITEVEREFAKCKRRLEAVIGREQAWRDERRDMRREITALDAEVRALSGRKGLT